MAGLVVPELEEVGELWPTLGPGVCDFIEEYLTHGPGDLLGEAIELNDEQRGWLYRMYEVEPPFIVRRHNGVISRTPNPRAGKRRFQRCALSLRKGSSKTEFAAWITACELHPDAPVRCSGFDSDSDNARPNGCGVTDPYIPMISYSEEQTEELAYGALRRILERSPLCDDFDIGLGRIMRIGGDGKAEAVSATPNSRDGARTTFQHADETHRFILNSLKKAWSVMLANLNKRPIADPWALETTTAPEPGAESVAESTFEYAKAVQEGRAPNARLYFFHRQANDNIDISTAAGLREAVLEASGKYIASWSDVDRIVAAFEEPDADKPYLERVWLNRPVQATGRAFNIDQWRTLKREYVVPSGAAITIGFDGGRFDDATALVATEVDSGYQWPLGIWEKPKHLAKWEVPEHEVVGIVDDAFSRYYVVRMYCDPPRWEGVIAKWAGQYGSGRVAKWYTDRRRQMAFAIRAYCASLATGELTHNGDRTLSEHIANARRAPTGLVSEDDVPLWLLRKEQPDSEKKIDAAVASVLSWTARTDAMTDGAGAANDYNVYVIGVSQ